MSANDGVVEALDGFVRRFHSYQQKTDRVPPEHDAEIQGAVQAKRDGDYLRSVRLYAEMTDRWGVLYTGLLSSLYKTVVTSGHLREAGILLALAEEIYEKNPAKPPFPGMDMTSFFMEHFGELRRAVTTPAALHAYLQPLSGNPDYRLPTDYAIETSEFNAMLARWEAE